MKIRKVVSMEKEVAIDIGVDDIREALQESFAVVMDDRHGSPGPNRGEILMAINNIATFLKAITPAQIGLLTIGQCDSIWKFLTDQAAKFKVTEESGATHVGGR